MKKFILRPLAILVAFAAVACALILLTPKHEKLKREIINDMELYTEQEINEAMDIVEPIAYRKRDKDEEKNVIKYIDPTSYDESEWQILRRKYDFDEFINIRFTHCLYTLGRKNAGPWVYIGWQKN